MEFKQKASYDAEDLVRIMRLLRGENGCPWDREQSHGSIRRNLLEEAFEAAEAIDLNDPELLKEELGDVLLQVVFHAQMEEEAGGFSFDDVADGICKKLIQRHPHVFGDVAVKDSGEVLKNWESIKQAQKGQSSYTDTLKSVPKTFPALMRAEKIQKRAGKAGFCYPGWQAAFADLESELDELKQAAESGKAVFIAEELGDLLFAAVNVARHLEVDPEDALNRSSEKFTRRFEGAEKLAGERNIHMSSASLKELDILWGEVKNKELNLEVL